MTDINVLKNRAIDQITDVAKKCVHALASGSANYIKHIYKSGQMKDVVDDEGNKYNKVQPTDLADHVVVIPENYKDIQSGSRVSSSVLMDDEDSDKEARIHEAMGNIAPFKQARSRASDSSNIKKDLAQYGIF